MIKKIFNIQNYSMKIMCILHNLHTFDLHNICKREKGKIPLYFSVIVCYYDITKRDTKVFKRKGE